MFDNMLKSCPNICFIFHFQRLFSPTFVLFSPYFILFRVTFLSYRVPTSRVVPWPGVLDPSYPHPVDPLPGSPKTARKQRGFRPGSAILGPPGRGGSKKGRFWPKTERFWRGPGRWPGGTQKCEK